MNTRAAATRSPTGQAAPVRILAVDPGTRYMGIAILAGDELLRADVENIREAGMSPAEVCAKAHTVLRQWIRRYQPDAIAVELPHFAQSKASRPLGRLVHAIMAVAKQEGLNVRPYLPMTVRRRVCPTGRPTRLAIAREVAGRFPWLAHRYRKETEKSWWEKPYWLTMFDAIAVGLVCGEDHRHRHPRGKAA